VLLFEEHPLDKSRSFRNDREGADPSAESAISRIRPSTERRARTTALAITAAAQNGTSGRVRWRARA